MRVITFLENNSFMKTLLEQEPDPKTTKDK